MQCLTTNLDELCSNHYSVLLMFNSIPPNKPTKPCLIQGKMDWETFCSSLENKIKLILKFCLKSLADIDACKLFNLILTL